MIKMIEHLLSRNNLNRAYLKVYRNKGGAGIDEMTVHDLKDHLVQHQSTYSSQIRGGRYQVAPILGKRIPKKNGKYRLLGIPTVVDRVYQQALHQVLTPLFERDFQAHSYGFRPHRDAHQALRQSETYINAGYQVIVDIDLQSFFDEIRHVVLLDLIYKMVKCPLILKLLRGFLRSPIKLDGSLHKRRKGVPQGSPLSPLLANIMLNELDKELEKRGHRYVRYADDFSIYVKSEKAAQRVFEGISKFLSTRLHLPINHTKSGIRSPETFQILGYGYEATYKNKASKPYQLKVSPSALERLQSRLKWLTKKTRPLSFEERIGQLNKQARGWLNYYRLAAMYSAIARLDKWLRRRLRYCIWHDWKKPERRRKNLIRLGVSAKRAYAWSRTRLGGWRIAGSPILGTTITNQRLQKRNYFRLLDYYQQIRVK